MFPLLRIFQVCTIDIFGYGKLRNEQYKWALIYFTTFGMAFTGPLTDVGLEILGGMGYERAMDLVFWERKAHSLLFLAIHREMYKAQIIDCCIVIYFFLGDMNMILENPEDNRIVEFLNLFLNCAICYVFNSATDLSHIHPRANDIVEKMRRMMIFIYLLKNHLETLFHATYSNLAIPVNMIYFIYSFIKYSIQFVFNFTFFMALLEQPVFLCIMISMNFSEKSVEKFSLRQIENVVIILILRAFVFL